MLRAYITMENEDDFLSALRRRHQSDLRDHHDNFYHSVLAAVPNGINSLLFPVYPDLEFDSWVTIGLEVLQTPQMVRPTFQRFSPRAILGPAIDPGGGLPGGSIAIDDIIGGAWYALTGDANGYAGADLECCWVSSQRRGAVMQLYTQIFIYGDGQNEVPAMEDRAPNVHLVLAGHNRRWRGVRMNPRATTCLALPWMTGRAYPEDPMGPRISTVNCLNDTDGDGICDEDEPCSDLTACDCDGSAPETAAYCLVTDTVAVHDAGALAGMTTYRLSLQCENAPFRGAVAGYENPSRLMTSTEFYQNELGGPSNGINSVLYPSSRIWNTTVGSPSDWSRCLMWGGRS